jgi:hypothetical protein
MISAPEYGVTIVPKHCYLDVGETRAVTTLSRIMKLHGEGHPRLVLSTLARTANKRLLDDVLLWLPLTSSLFGRDRVNPTRRRARLLVCHARQRTAVHVPVRP